MSHEAPTPAPAAAPATPPPLVIAGHGTRVNAGATAATVLVDKVRERASNSGRPLKRDEVKALLEHHECLNGGVC